MPPLFWQQAPPAVLQKLGAHKRMERQTGCPAAARPPEKESTSGGTANPAFVRPAIRFAAGAVAGVCRRIVGGYERLGPSS